MSSGEVQGESPSAVPPGTALALRLPIGGVRLWGGLAAVACSCAVVALVDPSEHALTPPCPFRVVSGWWCPFCGASRAASRLMRGDFSGAARFNVMLLILGPLLALMWATWALPEKLPWLDPLRRHHRQILGTIAAVLVAFTVVRNLPFAADSLRYPGA